MLLLVVSAVMCAFVSLGVVGSVVRGMRLRLAIGVVLGHDSVLAVCLVL